MQIKSCWAILIWTLYSPFVFAQSDTLSQETFAENYIRLAQHQKELLQQRIRIAEKWREWRSKEAKDDYRLGYTPLSRIDAEIEIYLGEIRKIETDIARFQVNQVDQEKLSHLIRLFSKQHDLATEVCLRDQCNKRLAPFQKVYQLSTDLIQVDSKLLESFLLKEEPKEDSTEQTAEPNSFLLAHALLSLQEQRFSCERTLMTLRYNSILQAQPMAECLEAIIAEHEPLHPTFPKDEQWPSLLHSMSSIDSPTNSVQNFLSGKEPALETWTLKQQPASIRPWDFFEQAYLLSEGNLYLALRTAFNVLRLNRTRPPFQRNLIDIRGDRPNRGDNSGDWYHFFGTMLAWRTTGYITYLGAMYYQITGGEEEEAGPLVRGAGHDEKESRIDLAGIETMQFLNDRLQRRYSTKTTPPPPPATDRKRACRLEHVLLFK